MAAPLYIPTNRVLIYPHSHHLQYSGFLIVVFQWVQFSFSSVAQSCLTLCNPIDCSTPGFPVPWCLPEFAQVCIHWVMNMTIQPSLPLSPPSPPPLNLPQHQGLFQWVGCLHQVAKLLANLLLNIYSKEIKFKGNKLVNSLVVQWLRLGAFPAVDQSSIPGQGTKIP